MRWGFIGFGKIAKKFLSSLKQVDGQSITAIATKSGLVAAKQMAPEATLFQDYEELAASDQVDIVYINTTHNFHLEQTLLCLNYGKHVICEKPMGLHPDDIQKIKDHQGDCFVMEAIWSRFLPAYQQAITWIEEGKIGRPHLVKADFAFHSPLPKEGRLLNPSLAGGALYDVGIYPLSFALDIYQHIPPTKINKRIDWTDTGVDGRTTFELIFGGNRSAQLYASILDDTPNEAIIVGDNGYIKMESFWKCQQLSLNVDKKQITLDLPFQNTGYFHEIQAAIDSIKKGHVQHPLMTLDHSHLIADIMNQILTNRP